MDAKTYNDQRVPIYAPDGFPDWTNLNDLAVSDSKFRSRLREIQVELGVTADGFCGPSTIDAIAWADLGRKRESDEERLCRGGFVIIGPFAVPVDVPTRLYVDYFDMGETGSRARTSDRDKITQAILHYDVTFSAEQTHKVLLDKGYSTHFTIDGDDEGTIWQHHNPVTRVCYHAGDSNRMSVGVDLNNPALPKWQDDDYDRRGRRRGVAEQIVHGRTVQRLEYHPEQIDSLCCLLDEMLPALGIPRRCPRDEKGRPIHDLLDHPQNFEGVIGHYHEDRDKTDPAPLDWDEVCPE